MIAIIASSGSNIASVLFALQRLGCEAQLTTDPTIIRQASHVILPGVGHAAYAMEQLTQHQLITTIKELTQPVLGICLGMHLLFEHSTEGNVNCLGIIPGKVTQLRSEKPKSARPKPETRISIPHMGWNQLSWQTSGHPLQQDIEEDAYVYFVHSFAVPVTSHCLARFEHGENYAAIVGYRNFFAMQFHPERSGSVGERLLTNFLSMGLTQND